MRHLKGGKNISGYMRNTTDFFLNIISLCLVGRNKKLHELSMATLVIVCLILTKPDAEHNAASPEQMKNDFFQVGRGPTQSRNRGFMHQSQTLLSKSSLVNRTRRKMLPSCVQTCLIVKLLCREHLAYHSHNVPFTQQSKRGGGGVCGGRV